MHGVRGLGGPSVPTLTPAGPMGPTAPEGPGEPCKHTTQHLNTGSASSLPECQRPASPTVNLSLSPPSLDPLGSLMLRRNVYRKRNIFQIGFIGHYGGRPARPRGSLNPCCRGVCGRERLNSLLLHAGAWSACRGRQRTEEAGPRGGFQIWRTNEQNVLNGSDEGYMRDKYLLLLFAVKRFLLSRLLFWLCNPAPRKYLKVGSRYRRGSLKKKKELR